MNFKKLENVKGFNTLTDFQKLMFQIMHSNVETGGCLLISSPPGMGKTQIIQELFTKIKAPLFDIRLSQKDETEVGLFPVVVKDDDDQPLYVKEIPPHWAHMANESDSEYVGVVFEELNRGRREIQNGALQILMERAIGHDFFFDKKVLFVATSNIDDAYTEEFSDAMKGRLVHIPFEFKYQDWKNNWAIKNINPIILKWLDNNPEYMLETPSDEQIAYCSPRSIERLSNCLSYVSDIKSPDIKAIIDYVRFVGSNIIGESSNMFLEFLKKYAKVKASDILDNYDNVEQEFATLDRADVINIVEDLKTIFTSGDTYSYDQHMNVVKFLKYEIDGLELVEDDIKVSFVKEFADSMSLDELSDIIHIDPRYKVYIKEFDYEISRLFEKPKKDELIKIFSSVTGINTGTPQLSNTSSDTVKTNLDSATYGYNLSGNTVKGYDIELEKANMYSSADF